MRTTSAPGTDYCSTCKTDKPVQAFVRGGHRRKTCNKCAARCAEQHQKQRKNAGNPPEGMKWCSSCSMHRYIDHFWSAKGEVLRTCYRCRGLEKPHPIPSESCGERQRNLRKDDPKPLRIPSPPQVAAPPITPSSWYHLKLDNCFPYSVQALGVDCPVTLA